MGELSSNQTGDRLREKDDEQDDGSGHPEQGNAERAAFPALLASYV
jgi:hypothetical protein